MFSVPPGNHNPLMWKLLACCVRFLSSGHLYLNACLSSWLWKNRGQEKNGRLSQSEGFLGSTLGGTNLTNMDDEDSERQLVLLSAFHVFSRLDNRTPLNTCSNPSRVAAPGFSAHFLVVIFPPFWCLDFKAMLPVIQVRLEGEKMETCKSFCKQRCQPVSSAHHAVCTHKYNTAHHQTSHPFPSPHSAPRPRPRSSLTAMRLTLMWHSRK